MTLEYNNKNKWSGVRGERKVQSEKVETSLQHKATLQSF